MLRVTISEDDEKHAPDQIQKATDKHIEEVIRPEAKETDVMAV